MNKRHKYLNEDQFNLIKKYQNKGVNAANTAKIVDNVSEFQVRKAYKVSNLPDLYMPRQRRVTAVRDEMRGHLSTYDLLLRIDQKLTALLRTREEKTSNGQKPSPLNWFNNG